MAEVGLAGRIRAVLARVFGLRLGYRPERHYMRGTAGRRPSRAAAADDAASDRTGVDPPVPVPSHRSERTTTDLS